MKYSLNDYSSYLLEKGIRIEIYPNKHFAAKLVAEYTSNGFKTIQCCQLVQHSSASIPTPKEMVSAMSAYIAKAEQGIIFTGIDSYTTFLHTHQERDFVHGLRKIVEQQRGNARILISHSFNLYGLFDNPKFRDSLQVVEFLGDQCTTDELSIQLLPQKWIGNCIGIPNAHEAMHSLGQFMPSGSHTVWIPDNEMPSEDYGNITVINRASDALSVLYGQEIPLSESDAELLLAECKDAKATPDELLLEKLGGNEYLTKEKAAPRLHLLQDDKLWSSLVWMLKSKIPADSYLYQVLEVTDSPEQYWQNYVINSAVSCMGKEHAGKYAEERASVLRGTNDSLIAGFVSVTIDDDRAIPFLNCESDFEMAGLIRHASKFELGYGLPDAVKKVAQILSLYLSPNFDYGTPELTSYFSDLRCHRVYNTVDEAFVQRAYSAVIPPVIKKRKEIISGYNDGETALLVVDGMGAEYYPLLLTLAKQNGINIAEQCIVSASLPSSTQYNEIPWNAALKLQEVKRTDTISHSGYSAHEKCPYEDNLAEIFRVFRKDIIPRILKGLKDCKRVLVTADHGASYLAVSAHKNKMIKTLPWAGIPNDWRYASLSKPIETPEGMISEYHANEQKTYYIVRGYNRLPKEGGKEYALHGGATLEEMLVPLVVFTKETVTKPSEEPVEQLIENDDFDIL